MIQRILSRLKIDDLLRRVPVQDLVRRLPVDRLVNQFKNMTVRERIAVSGAVVLVVVLLVYQVLISPFIEVRDKRRKMIAEKALQVQEMAVMRDEYMSMMARGDSLRRMASGKESGFTLFAFLEQLAGQTGIKENISYMKPSKSVQKDTQVTLSLVEIKLQGVDMKKLMDFLFQVETSPNAVFVRGVSLTKSGKDELLTAILQIETVEGEG